MKRDYIIEAVLFSVGRAVSIEEIADTTKFSPDQIKKSMKKLITEYENREGAIEISKAGAKYAMQLKSDYAIAATKLADMEVPKKLLKTLALIVYHQPIKQSELQNIIGPKVYDHVRELHEFGFIRTRREGRSKVLTTTKRMPEYFGISTTDRDEIRKWLVKKLKILEIKKVEKEEIKQEETEKEVSEEEKSE